MNFQKQTKGGGGVSFLIWVFQTINIVHKISGELQFSEKFATEVFEMRAVGRDRGPFGVFPEIHPF